MFRRNWSLLDIKSLTAEILKRHFESTLRDHKMFNEFQKVSRFKKNEHNLLNVYIIYSSIDQLLKKRTGISESSSEKLEENIS